MANWISFNLHTAKAKRGKIRGRRKSGCAVWEGSYQTCQKDYCNEGTCCHDPAYKNRADYQGRGGTVQIMLHLLALAFLAGRNSGVLPGKQGALCSFCFIRVVWSGVVKHWVLSAC